MKIIRAIMEDTIMGQEKYTAKTLAALQSAQQIAAMKYHQEITSAHVLLALAKEPEGLLATIFEECQTDMPMLKARLEQELAKTTLADIQKETTDCLQYDAAASEER